VARRATPLISLFAAVALFAAPALAATTLTPANAKRIATAIELRASDLPGYTPKPNPFTAADRRVDDQLTSCYGGVAVAKALANEQSPVFTRASSGQQVQVNSSTEVLPSAALAVADMNASLSPRGLSCAQSAVAKAVRAGLEKNEKFLFARTTRLATLLPDVKNSVYVRVVIWIQVTNGSTRLSVPAYDDAVGFVDGGAEVSLNTLSIPLKPDVSLERTLAGDLAARAKAAIG
jgi:hypothetical protein